MLTSLQTNSQRDLNKKRKKKIKKPNHNGYSPHTRVFSKILKKRRQSFVSKAKNLAVNLSTIFSATWWITSNTS